MTSSIQVIDSPVGPLALRAMAGALVGVDFLDAERPEPRVLPEDSDVLARAAQQLEEYFAGTRTEFDLPTAADGTPFQKAVWRALSEIGYGETRSYLDIAVAIGNPKAVRAVGLANGRNPLSIVVPCHRVIGSNGSLTGFGGGLERKRWLLEFEGSRVFAGVR